MAKCTVKTPKRSTSRTTGLVLMLAGVLVLIIFLPKWLWASILGVVLISVGFLVWRFRG